MNYLKKMISLFLCFQFMAVAQAQTQTQPQENNSFNLQEVTLPSELKDLPKNNGAIYYNNSVKNKVLLPANFWGEVHRPGLHFIPTDSSLIRGLSMAGGPTSNASLREIVLIRKKLDGKLEEHFFDLTHGGDMDAHNFQLESGDSIFIKRDRFFENRAYYTGLIGIAVSVLTAIFIYQKIQKN